MSREVSMRTVLEESDSAVVMIFLQCRVTDQNKLIFIVSNVRYISTEHQGPS
jgi:uncharacterized lipoprotein YbaY